MISIPFGGMSKL